MEKDKYSKEKKINREQLQKNKTKIKDKYCKETKSKMAKKEKKEVPVTRDDKARASLSQTPKNPICSGCYRWQLFKEKCYFYWEGKKLCSSKVRSEEELVMLERMRARI